MWARPTCSGHTFIRLLARGEGGDTETRATTTATTTGTTVAAAAAAITTAVTPPAYP
jgi:hypothetical protein